MISGVKEGYVESSEVKTKTVIDMPFSVALLFKEMCEGIDLARNESYRYNYIICLPPKAYEIFDKGNAKIIIQEISH